MPTLSRLRTAAAVFVFAVAIAAIFRPTVAAQSSSRERTLYVSAVDDKGEPVDGLGPEAFVIREDGARREVLRVSRASEPIDIALLVDNSAATSGKITFIRDAVASFVATIGPGNHIAIVTLADRPTIVTDYTSDPKRLKDAAGRFFPMPGSGATLLDAVAEVSRGLAKREASRAVILPVITDGPEFTNRYSRDVTNLLIEARAALDVVAIGRFEYIEEQGIRERLFLLDEGTRKSGGQHVMLLTPNALDSVMQRIARELSSQYKVVYSRPESLIPPETTEISSARDAITMRGTPSREDGRTQVRTR